MSNVLTGDCAFLGVTMADGRFDFPSFVEISIIEVLLENLGGVLVESFLERLLEVLIDV